MPWFGLRDGYVKIELDCIGEPKKNHFIMKFADWNFLAVLLFFYGFYYGYVELRTVHFALRRQHWRTEGPIGV